MKREDLPPPYDECVTPSRSQEQIRPITSGPVEYPGKCFIMFFVASYMFCQFCTKIVTGITIISVGYNDQPLKQSLPNKLGVIICVLHIINSLNFWEYHFFTYRQHMTVKRWSGLGFCFSGFFFFLLDTCFLFFLSIGFALAKVENGFELMSIPCLILVISNIFIFIIFLNNDVYSYHPADGTTNLFLTRRSEDCFYDRKPLAIKESGPFRIVIQNCGTSKWTSPLLVERVVSKYKRDRKGRQRVTKEKSRFGLRLIKPLEPSASVAVIPETHSEEDTYRILGFRAFGPSRGHVVNTALYDDRKLCIVRLTEEFKKDKFRLRQIRLMEEGEEDSE